MKVKLFPVENNLTLNLSVVLVLREMCLKAAPMLVSLRFTAKHSHQCFESRSGLSARAFSSQSRKMRILGSLARLDK